MKYDDWQKIHKSTGTDILSLCMDFKHGRISACHLIDMIESYVDKAYELGKKNMRKTSVAKL